MNRHRNGLSSFARSPSGSNREGVDLFLGRVPKRMSPPKSSDYRIARDFFTEVKREILAEE